MEILFRPSVPDNLTLWQVFEDDAQAIRFIKNLQEFAGFDPNLQEEGSEDAPN